MNIALIYGSMTGNTEIAAELIKDHLGEHLTEYLEVGEIEVEDLTKYDVVLVGCPTWDIGELQYDWQPIYDDLEDADLNGTRFAFFGMGDQSAYPDTYQDAIGMLHDAIKERGGGVGLGYTSIEDHEFIESKAARDGKFVGLALDHDCQPELTEPRCQAWAAQLLDELSLSEKAVEA